MVQIVPTCTRVEQSVRWHRAAERAQAEGIQVRQLQGSGAWIATSGTQRGVAYELRVTGNVAHGCDCLAGLNGDPVCKHRAAFYLLIGALDLSPQPDPPALGAVSCLACNGCGQQWHRGGFALPCDVCRGMGAAPLAAQASALVAAASVATCDHCGGPLDDDARTDDALQMVCGACIADSLAEARIARQDAMHVALAA